MRFVFTKCRYSLNGRTFGSAAASVRATARGGERRSRVPPLLPSLSLCPPLRPPPRVACTYVNHCMIIVRILLLDILMIVSRVG